MGFSISAYSIVAVMSGGVGFAGGSIRSAGRLSDLQMRVANAERMIADHAARTESLILALGRILAVVGSEISGHDAVGRGPDSPTAGHAVAQIAREALRGLST